MSALIVGYEAAVAEACAMAIACHCDVGVERASEYGTKGYSVFLLPRPEKRFGYELRAQVVSLAEALATNPPALVSTDPEGSNKP